MGLGLSLGRLSGPIRPAPFSPYMLGSSVLAWWDASQGITVTGSGVSAWADRKNGYTLVQATDASRPAYSATGFNGAPGLTFDGTADCLGLESQPFPTNDGNIEGWAVVQNDAVSGVAGNRHIITIGGASPAEARVHRGPGNNTFSTTIAGATVATTVAEYSSRHVVRGIIRTGFVSISVDGSTPVTTAADPAIGSTRVRIGANSQDTAGGFWQGKMRDVIVTNLLTTAQAASMHAFLASRRNP